MPGDGPVIGAGDVRSRCTFRKTSTSPALFPSLFRVEKVPFRALYAIRANFQAVYRSRFKAFRKFDSAHYRIIYQTFFGMRDVIRPLSLTPKTAVLPFQYRKLPTAERVVVECCPSSVLKKMGQPHQNYKQPTGGPLTRRRKLTRHRLLAALAEWVDIPANFRRVVMRNPGGDALDAVIAAVGAWRAVPAADHRAIARHHRYRHEGRMYV